MPFSWDCVFIFFEGVPILGADGSRVWLCGGGRARGDRARAFALLALIARRMQERIEREAHRLLTKVQFPLRRPSFALLFRQRAEIR